MVQYSEFTAMIHQFIKLMCRLLVQKHGTETLGMEPHPAWCGQTILSDTLREGKPSNTDKSPINHGEKFLPSSVSRTLYKSGRRSRNTPQPCLLDFIFSRSNSATRTPSSLSSAAATISPVGPVHHSYMHGQCTQWHGENTFELGRIDQECPPAIKEFP